MSKRELPPSGKGNNQQQIKVKYIKKLPVRLDNETADILYNALPPRANQAKRLVKLLSFNPDAPTNRLNKGSGVNLSDVARKYKRYLKPHGYYIDCRKPPKPIKNSFGEDSGQQLWGIYSLKGGEQCQQ